MIHLHQFIQGALADVLRRAPLSPEKVAFAWRWAVGPAVDRVTMVDLRAGVLQVRARDASWQREIERSAAVVRTRLNRLLGEGAVRGIEVTLDGTTTPRR